MQSFVQSGYNINLGVAKISFVSESKMICSVGLVCVDIVNFMPEYPPEDADSRY